MGSENIREVKFTNRSYLRPRFFRLWCGLLNYATACTDGYLTFPFKTAPHSRAEPDKAQAPDHLLIASDRELFHFFNSPSIAPPMMQVLPRTGCPQSYRDSKKTIPESDMNFFLVITRKLSNGLLKEGLIAVFCVFPQNQNMKRFHWH